MRQVWKTPLRDVKQEVTIGLVLHVGYDVKIPDAPAVVWHYAEPAHPRTLYVVGTGHPVPDDGYHLGSAITPEGFVFHVFEARTE